MYSARQTEGLGFAFDFGKILTDVIIPVGGTIGSAFAVKLISGPSGPSQKEIEKQIRLQQQFEIQKAVMQQQQTRELMQYALPAAGLVALVMLLR